MRRQQSDRRMILGFLAGGPLKSDVLQERLKEAGYEGGPKAVLMAVMRHERDGLLVRPEHGVYQLTRAGLEQWCKWFDCTERMVRLTKRYRKADPESFSQ